MKTICTALVALALLVPAAKADPIPVEKLAKAGSTIIVYVQECGGSIGPGKQRILDALKSLDGSDFTDAQAMSFILDIANDMARVGKSAWCANFQEAMQK